MTEVAEVGVRLKVESAGASESVKTLSEVSGFNVLRANLEKKSNALVETNSRLQSEIVNRENEIRERRRSIYENHILIEVNARKSRAIEAMAREFEDAETMRVRALEDYEG